MKTLADQIKQALSALTFGDIGERVGRRERHAALFPATPLSSQPATSAPGPVPTAMPAPHQWIALGVGDDLPPHVMSYVIAACRRMQADLLLISVDALRVRQLLAAYLPDLQGIECRTEELASTSAAAVARALDLHRGVLFAVSGTDNDPLRALLRARRGTRSPVPVVLVSPKSTEAAASPRRKSTHLAAHA